MSTAILDVSSIVSTCKDHLSAEWADFKKSGAPKSQKVCLYSIGGPRDNPAAVLASVACGVAEWELLLKDVVDAKVPSDRPLLESEVVVGADGSIDVFPLRHKDREKHYTTAYTVTTTETAIAAQTQPARSKQKKKPVLKTPEEQFMAMVEQVANYMLDHVKKMSQPAVPSGNMKSQYLLIGSATLIRNRLNYFREIFRLQPTKTFTDTVCRASELVEVVSQTVLNYHCDIIRSSLLHDADSHDWQNERRYQEGEKLSSAVHMWIFYMQGVRNDLFRYTSPRLAESIMSSVLSDTLNILVTRYLQAEPSEFRLTQYRADVLAILAMLASLLPALSSTPMHVFTAGLHSTVVLPLHRRAQLLLAVAAVKAAPLNIVANNRKLLLTPQLSTASNSPSSLHILSTPAWLSFLNPGLYPPGVTNLAALPSNVAAYHMMLTVASGAGPNWTLIVRSLVQKDMYGARTLLGGLRDYWSGACTPQPCGGALCCPHLCSPPLTPQTVYAAVVQIVYRCVKGRGLLKSLMFPSAVQPAVWTSLDQSQVWNTQRPPWHHVLVQLAVPAVLPAVHQVVQSLPLEAPAQPAHPSQVSVRLEHHLTTWTVQLLQGVSSCAEELPLALLSLCRDLTAALPSTVRPTGGHVICQVLVNALYGIINSRASLDTLSASSDGITEAQWNMMVAVAERLCSLQTEAFQQPVAAMASAIQARLDNVPQEEDSVPNSLSEYENCEEAAEAECEALTSMVLGSVQGQHALGVMWEFLQHNMEWVQHLLGAPPLLPFQPDLPAQAPQLVFAPQPLLYNPLYYHARIFYSRFEHMGVLSHSSDWDLALRCVPAWLSPRTVLTLISFRPELQEDADLNADLSNAAATLTPLLETLHEE